MFFFLSQWRRREVALWWVGVAVLDSVAGWTTTTTTTTRRPSLSKRGTIPFFHNPPLEWPRRKRKQHLAKVSLGATEAATTVAATEATMESTETTTPHHNDIDDANVDANVDDNVDDNVDAEGSFLLYQQALQRSNERALDDFMQEQVPEWMTKRRQNEPPAGNEGNNPHNNDADENASSSSQLPFSCTGCGKCCRTQGDVYLEPQDIRQATQLTGASSMLVFCQTYASHYLIMPPRGGAVTEAATSSSTTPTLTEALLEQGRVWIRLKSKLAGGDGGCIFLDNDTNQCQIYEARPVQCRTYPFWPHILATPKLWNAECRRMESGDSEDSEDSDDNDSSLPRWTPETGGCEGMRRLTNENEFPDHDADKNKNNTNDNDNNTNDNDGVALRDACRQLMEYHCQDCRIKRASPTKRMVLLTTTRATRHDRLLAPRPHPS